MGYLGGVLDGSFREEIRLFYRLFLLVDNLQSAEGVIIIVTVENLLIYAVVDVAVLLYKAVVLRV